MNPFYKIYTEMNFKAAPELNPDSSGRPSPVVVKVFQLASRTVFDTSGFFKLYDDAEAILKGDLLAKDELDFRPGQTFIHQLKLSPDTKYIGVVVAYQDISNSRWRAVIPADPESREYLDIFLEKQAIYFKER